jgi:hypothetical protein
VSLVGQELHILPEHLRSQPVFSVVYVANFFCCNFCRPLSAWLFVVGFFGVFFYFVMSVLLPFAASNYDFGVFKLFPQSHNDNA